jgi:hypothetical protein
MCLELEERDYRREKLDLDPEKSPTLIEIARPRTFHKRRPATTRLDQHIVELNLDGTRLGKLRDSEKVRFKKRRLRRESSEISLEQTSERALLRQPQESADELLLTSSLQSQSRDSSSRAEKYREC